jgi:hypothetical protein
LQAAVISVPQLDDSLVLAPERYDPRRHSSRADGEPLLGYVRLGRDLVSPASHRSNRTYLVLDTGDAREGFLFTKRRPVKGSELGSVKKLLLPGDVVISRLRPYLRQVALVDSGLADFQTVDVACSTEFYVLRAPPDRSIAFLVPFLLSEPVQEILAASQEGGHHPRFSDRTLASLTVPEPLVTRRHEVSAQVSELIELMRRGTLGLAQLIADTI